MSCRFVPPSAVPLVPLGAFATAVVGVLGFMDGEVEEVLVALAYRQQYSELVTSMQANSMSCQYLAILQHDWHAGITWLATIIIAVKCRPHLTD